MIEQIFDHDRLDVYRLSIDYVASSFRVAKNLRGLHHHARDQWLRAAQSIPLNIARGDVAREDSVEYNADVEYEYEYRDAEYEYEIQTDTQ